MNEEFHLELYEVPGARLSSLIGTLREASNPYISMYVTEQKQKPTEQANEEHQAILDACIGGDVDRAQRTVRRRRPTAPASRSDRPQRTC